MRNVMLSVLAALATLSVLSLAAAADKMVYQKGRAFSTDVITLHRGEAVTFVNDDTVPHNLTSNSGNNHFDLGSQAPGKAVPISFDENGLVAVICAIHPRMRMTIRVVD